MSARRRLAVAALALCGAAVVAPGAQADPTYETECGSSIHEGPAPSGTRTYRSQEGGHATYGGVIGEWGYAEASTNHRRVRADGALGGRAFSAGDDGACAR